MSQAREAVPEQAEVDPEELDLGYLALFLGMRVNELVTESLQSAGYPALRTAHGFLIQYLLTGAKSVGELATLAGVTQQAISKTLKEMALAELIEDVPSSDARLRKVTLSAHGREVVARGRAERLKLHRKLTRASGRDLIAARRVLLRGLELLGGIETIRQRRVRPQ